jgi:signal transduction histidine kinase
MPIQQAFISEDQNFVLSSLPPGRAERRLAIGILLGLLIALYLVLGPFGGMQLGTVRSFVAVYATAMFVTDFITAILLFAQFTILRSRAILMIASGYLFTAFLIVPYALAFPGVFLPEGVVGDLQTAARLYLVWHCGFPIFIIGYALLKDEDAAARVSQGEVRRAVLRSVAATAALAAVATLVCLDGDAFLPQIMLDRDRFVPEWPYVVGAPIMLLCGSALIVLWLRRRSILDLFLMVVLCAYMIEIPPHWYPAPARFSTGWYAVRVTGFLSSSIVLIVLLYEITALYGELLRAVLGKRHERTARLMTGDALAASIAHELRQPLTAMVTTADAGLRFLDRTTPNLEKAKETFKRIVADGHRAGEVIASIRASFRSNLSDRAAIDANALIEETMILARDELDKHRIVVQLEQCYEVPEVIGNRLQLQQVLLNLIVNAADAMMEADAPRVLRVKSEAYEPGHVKISVTDTGRGVCSQDAMRLFTPQFTTKPEGMGMGLSICRAIIEVHEGRLWFSPNTPQGAVFQFTLPGRNSGREFDPDTSR